LTSASPPDIGDYRVGFIRCSGHEKFVKNMLAGIGGIDIALLVWRPRVGYAQTRAL